MEETGIVDEVHVAHFVLQMDRVALACLFKHIHCSVLLGCDFREFPFVPVSLERADEVSIIPSRKI